MLFHNEVFKSKLIPSLKLPLFRFFYNLAGITIDQYSRHCFSLLITPAVCQIDTFLHV